MHKIQSLAAEEAKAHANGNSATTPGVAAAVANPVHVQLAGLGLQLAATLVDDPAKLQVRLWALLDTTVP